MDNLVALYRAVVALGSPVGEKILHRVAQTGLPKLIGLRGVVRDERVKETLRGPLFRVVAERVPQRHNRDQRKRRDGEGHGSGFIWFIGRWIGKWHSVGSFPASVGIKSAVVALPSLHRAATPKS